MQLHNHIPELAFSWKRDIKSNSHKVDLQQQQLQTVSSLDDDSHHGRGQKPSKSYVNLVNFAIFLSSAAS